MNGCILITMLPFLLPIIAAIFFIVKIFFKSKAESWKGEVIDKSHTSKRESFEDHPKMEHFYSLKIKMENGQIRNIAVSSQFFDECEIGDIVEKPKGEIYPKKAPKL